VPVDCGSESVEVVADEGAGATFATGVTEGDGELGDEGWDGEDPWAILAIAGPGMTYSLLYGGV
jgi:hypothetical protein